MGKGAKFNAPRGRFSPAAAGRLWQPFFAFLRLLRGRCRRKRLRQPGRRRPAAAGEKSKKSFALSPGVSSLHGLDVRLLPIVLTVAKFFRTKFRLERRFFKTKNGQKITKTKGSDKKLFGRIFFLAFQYVLVSNTKQKISTSKPAGLNTSNAEKLKYKTFIFNRFLLFTFY